MRTYKMQMRMGIHSGSCVGGVVGSKMPHFSVFGDTVNIAALMESTSEPMKIQISHTTMELLEELGGFNCAVRGQMVVPRIGEVRGSNDDLIVTFLFRLRRTGFLISQ